MRVAFLLAILLVAPSARAGGYGHSYSYGGYRSYWPGGVWAVDGRYYAPGYYTTYGYDPTVRVIQYVGTPVYYPVGVSSFNPAVAAVPDPMRPLANVAPPKAAPPGTCDSHYKQLRDELETLKRALQLKSPATPPAAPLSTPPAEQKSQAKVDPLTDALAVVQVSIKKSCLACHANEVADEKGKAKGEAHGFSLTREGGGPRIWIADGKLLTDLSAEELVELNRRVPNLQDMPPKKAVESGVAAAIDDRTMAAWVSVLSLLRPARQPMPPAK